VACAWLVKSQSGPRLTVRIIVASQWGCLLCKNPVPTYTSETPLQSDAPEWPLSRERCAIACPSSTRRLNSTIDGSLVQWHLWGNRKLIPRLGDNLMRKNLAANAFDSLESCLSKTFLLDVQDSMRRSKFATLDSPAWVPSRAYNTAAEAWRTW